VPSSINPTTPIGVIGNFHKRQHSTILIIAVTPPLMGTISLELPRRIRMFQK
jgi:hypothetical protein